MNAIFFSLSLQTHSQHYSISSCAYSGLHNNRRLLLSRSFRVSFWKNPGWLGGAKALGKLPVAGRPTILITVGQGPTALAVGAGGGCLDIFTLIFPSSSLSPSLWEAVRYRLKYCLKEPLNPKQPTNQFWKSFFQCRFKTFSRFCACM